MPCKVVNASVQQHKSCRFHGLRESWSCWHDVLSCASACGGVELPESFRQHAVAPLPCGCQGVPVGLETIRPN
eukprot:2880261-Amphidinium_carterae.1